MARPRRRVRRARPRQQLASAAIHIEELSGTELCHAAGLAAAEGTAAAERLRAAAAALRRAASTLEDNQDVRPAAPDAVAEASAGAGSGDYAPEAPYELYDYDETGAPEPTPAAGAPMPEPAPAGADADAGPHTEAGGAVPMAGPEEACRAAELAGAYLVSLGAGLRRRPGTEAAEELAARAAAAASVLVLAAPPMDPATWTSAIRRHRADVTAYMDRQTAEPGEAHLAALLEQIGGPR